MDIGEAIFGLIDEPGRLLVQDVWEVIANVTYFLDQFMRGRYSFTVTFTPRSSL